MYKYYIIIIIINIIQTFAWRTMSGCNHTESEALALARWQDQ